MSSVKKTTYSRESFDILKVKTPIHCALVCHICLTGTCFGVWNQKQKPQDVSWHCVYAFLEGQRGEDQNEGKDYVNMPTASSCRTPEER